MTNSIKRRYEWLKKLRWISRISSIISIAIILMFLFGEKFDVNKITTSQWIGFAFFPIGIVTGFIVGWRNEKIGGLISVLSLICFYLIYGLLLNDKLPLGIAFLIFTIPGFMFLFTGLFAEFAIRKPKKTMN